METKIRIVEENVIKHKDILEAAEIIKKGGLVAFPTETVYGLGANGLNAEAVKKIFKAKGRPSDNPLILHIANFSMLEELALIENEKIKQVTDFFWPGPLTLVLPKKPQVPIVVTAGLDTVAVRMPDHPVALELIKAAQVPIAAPSANLSGKPSPTMAHHVTKDLFGRIDMVLDGGSTGVGLESTVLDMSSEVPMILRPGGVTKEQLEQLLGCVAVDQAIVNAQITPKAPGMKYTHYSPDANVTIIRGELNKVKVRVCEIYQHFQREGKRVALIGTSELVTHEDFQQIQLKVDIGNKDNLVFMAQQLYSILRKCDEENIDEVIVEAVPIEGIGMAVMNRLEKAAGYNILTV